MLAGGAILVGLALVLASGGSLRELENLSLRNAPAMIVLFVVQGFVRSGLQQSPVLGAWTVTFWAGCCLGLIALMWPSVRTPGVPVMMTGLAANMLVVLANGAMPVVGGEQLAIDRTTEYFYRLEMPSDCIQWIGDVLPLGSSALVSLGDLLLFTGVVALLVAAAHPQSALRE